MKYPVISNSKCTELAAQLADGREPAIDPHVNWVGQGDEVELGPIVDAAERIIRQSRDWADSDKDRFEGKVSPILRRALADVPPDVLDDRGFWRFLALRYFWDFIAWREEGPFARGNYLKYVDAATNTESVLPRMYLRAGAVADNEDLASAVPKGTDFWRSHVLRVRTGSAPPLTRAFVARQAEHRLQTDALRAIARRLNRTWANIVLHTYDEGEASDLIEAIWESDANE